MIPHGQVFRGSVESATLGGDLVVPAGAAGREDILSAISPRIERRERLVIFYYDRHEGETLESSMMSVDVARDVGGRVIGDGVAARCPSPFTHGRFFFDLGNSMCDKLLEGARVVSQPC
ncbi:hypothetical protein EVAR_27966_1 [Eumeta japonica]|uniref:Uncharacterized protein n=1 Tax=Eumeta variegata TaxID=151549 RepID=A0A4C1WBZ4_EUMVA|nr:hypothetical protein EVAR_27966_1 [Eumeta japonica]